jgi:2-oxoglutarate ferredoxin oxidoreductase subunit delta
MPMVQKTQPTGKTSRKIGPVVQPERCKGCGICVAFCPERMLVPGDELNSYGYPAVKTVKGGPCRGCMSCYVMCPDLAIAFIRGRTGHAADDEGE